jgi:hypothetical protein
MLQASATGKCATKDDSNNNNNNNTNDDNAGFAALQLQASIALDSHCETHLENAKPLQMQARTAKQSMPNKATETARRAGCYTARPHSHTPPKTNGVSACP